MLGILVEHDHANCLNYLLQELYLKQVLEHFGMANSHSISTPLSISCTLSLSQSLQSKENVSKYKKFANSIYCLSLVNSLLYTTQTHPNIQFAVGLIA